MGRIISSSVLGLRVRKASSRKALETHSSPQERVYGGGGKKGIQAVGKIKQSGHPNLQGNRPNLQGEKIGSRANDNFYLSTSKGKLKVKK